ncbi:MAG: NAD(P)/FAD-dependent oxidoreductase [Betaproteobacteria bacterium]|nr:MAG: NAD(P)/FAD-dependent oxidoreductase [Betaproteobacteria bacterium]
MTSRRRHDIWDVAIVGGGIAGLTAAWHATRRGLAVCLFEPQPGYGGQVSTVNALDDWPATGPVSGVELAASLAGQLSPEVVELHNESVLAVRPEDGWLRVASASHGIRARRVIAASGAQLRPLDVPGETALRGKGVSQCAHCDGGFFRGHDVVVVGGGDAALQEALVLAEQCASVTIVSRSRLKARAGYVERAAAKTNVRFVWDCEVDAVLGDAGVTGVRLRNVRTGESGELPCAGVFPFIGVIADASYLPEEVQRDAGGRVVTDADLHSSVPGIFAIGAARAGYGGDLVTAAGEAALAATIAARDLSV